MFIDQVLVAVCLTPYSDRRLNQQCPFPLTLWFFICSPASLYGAEKEACLQADEQSALLG